MELFKRCLRVAALLCFGNFIWLFGDLIPLPLWANMSCLAGLLIFFIWFNIRPRRDETGRLRLRALIGGYEILACVFTVILLETLIYAAALISGWRSWMELLVNLLLFIPVILILLLNGFFRVVLTSARLRIVWRILLLACWWVPVFNIFIFRHTLKAARSEYFFAIARRELDEVHMENEDCLTRYPLFMVHGIFFRDWQHISYWGRIPQALSSCGARIYYGGQQSAAPVKQSAQELAVHLKKILAETGAEKVNIIAHSKGGLDSRYMISKLGMAGQVASLTTINTPHRGCVFAKRLMETLPKSVVKGIEKRYNRLFRHLGDSDPDFLGGVTDLRSDVCKKFNHDVPDSNGVLYQSIMSTMKSPRSAGFPLNLTWRLVNKYDQEPNDGLVARSSAHWGDFLGEVRVKGRRGVSHGDIIDMLREDIPGFDIRELYIGIVKGLKARGL